ncbi:SAM-dependent methyltransferase [Streptomyces sp. Ru73]|uniref:class I SAM-dependent methyltransferase n=1 Tax=Streptomyces sp. Ru73 TaxID=2080748 RepID=UPI000CDCFF1C|nr:class I SAM-dependent methyltransferase [Streptomyces sp. Ru73]POX38525.1 SAM-dependent methyltransferase [Streptomyces sp. Ru73]
MSASSQGSTAWEGFWRDAPAGEGEVFWDARPEQAVALHLPLFEEHFDPALPVIDLGCGNGTQTRFLAERYPRVIGVDVSASAIDRARREDPAGVAEYRQLDATDTGRAAALHTDVGDANVYMRGVLHQCAPEDRPRIVATIARLLGTRGRLFLVEPSEEAKAVLMSLVQRPEGPPPKVRAIFSHGIAPAEMPDGSIPDLLAAHGLETAGSGRLPLITTQTRPDGSVVEVPTNWLVARAREV